MKLYIPYDPSKYSSFYSIQCPVLICRFSETEYALLFPQNGMDLEPFEPTEGNSNLFRGNTETDEFYTSLKEVEHAMNSGNLGGPYGDLDIYKTDGRHYDVLGVFFYPDQEERAEEEA